MKVQTTVHAKASGLRFRLYAGSQNGIPSQKLTWNLKLVAFKRGVIHIWPLFRFHVSSRDGRMGAPTVQVCSILRCFWDAIYACKLPHNLKDPKHICGGYIGTIEVLTVTKGCPNLGLKKHPNGLGFKAGAIDTPLGPTRTLFQDIEPRGKGSRQYL